MEDMAYDIDVMIPPVPDDDPSAWALLQEQGCVAGEPPSVFRTFHDRLVARHPCFAALPPDQFDEARNVWADAPLWNNFGATIAMFRILSDRAEEVVPFLVETADRLGLVALDWQTKQIHRGDGLHGLTLTFEGGYPLIAPTRSAIEASVERLTPDGGPGFLLLEHNAGDYVQAGGGNGVFTTEWRAHDETGFRHWVIGRAGPVSPEEILIPGNGRHFVVRAHERLSQADVKTLLTAFADRQPRPPAFGWRDITSILGS